MNPRLVRESVSPYDGLVRLDHHARHGRDQLGRLVNLLGVDVGESGVRQDWTIERRVVVRLHNMPATTPIEGGGGSGHRTVRVQRLSQNQSEDLSRSALDTVSFKSAPTGGGSEVGRNGKIIITIGSSPLLWVEGGVGDKQKLII